MAGAERRAASFFNISQNLGRIVKPRAGVERQDSRGGFLIVRAEAVLPAVSSVKVGVSLEDEVHLPGEPEARVLEMREHRFGIAIGGRTGWIVRLRQSRLRRILRPQSRSCNREGPEHRANRQNKLKNKT